MELSSLADIPTWIPPCSPPCTFAFREVWQGSRASSQVSPVWTESENEGPQPAWIDLFIEDSLPRPSSTVVQGQGVINERVESIRFEGTVTLMTIGRVVTACDGCRGDFEGAVDEALDHHLAYLSRHSMVPSNRRVDDIWWGPSFRVILITFISDMFASFGDITALFKESNKETSPPKVYVKRIETSQSGIALSRALKVTSGDVGSFQPRRWNITSTNPRCSRGMPNAWPMCTIHGRSTRIQEKVAKAIFLEQLIYGHADSKSMKRNTVLSRILNWTKGVLPKQPHPWTAGKILLSGLLLNIAIPSLLPTTLAFVRRRMRPRVKHGYTRLEWVCDCGDVCYGDYQVKHNLKSMQRLRSQLHSTEYDSIFSTTFDDMFLLGVVGIFALQPLQSLVGFIWTIILVLLWLLRLCSDRLWATSKVTMQHNGPGAKGVSVHNGKASPTASVATNREPECQHRRIAHDGDDSMGHRAQPGGMTSSSSFESTRGPQIGERRFLELCINTGPISISLGELDLSQLGVRTDADLFRLIHRRYFDIRSRRTFSFLYKPVNIEFVRFGVVDGGRVGIYDKPMSIPPKKEVDEKRYDYYECPLDPLPPIDHRTFFHYFWKHQQHQSSKSDIFLSRLPKKLNNSMREECQPDRLNLGWVVHIIEGPDNRKISLCFFAILVASFLVSLVYSLAKRTQESGFGIGQWMVATLSAGLAALHFHLAE